MARDPRSVRLGCFYILTDLKSAFTFLSGCTHYLLFPPSRKGCVLPSRRQLWLIAFPSLWFSTQPFLFSSASIFSFHWILFRLLTQPYFLLLIFFIYNLSSQFYFLFSFSFPLFASWLFTSGLSLSPFHWLYVAFSFLFYFPHISRYFSHLSVSSIC